MKAEENEVVRKLRRAELAGETEVTLTAAEVAHLLNYVYREEEEPDAPTRSGYCEDYPCCGHEAGDCFGQKYGSDESIKAAAYERMRMEDEGYFFDGED